MDNIQIEIDISEKNISKLQKIIDNKILEEPIISMEEKYVTELANKYKFHFSDNKISYLEDSPSLRTDLLLRKKIVVTKANKLVEYFKNIINNLKKSIKTNENGVDFMKLLITLLNYKIGVPNNYDKELFNFCRQLRFDAGTVLAIYFAPSKEDVQQILKIYAPYHPFALMKILGLKKLSAYEKFKINYNIRDDYDLALLEEKMNIY